MNSIVAEISNDKPECLVELYQVFPAFGTTNTKTHIQPILCVSGLFGLGKDDKKQKNKFIFPVSFSQSNTS
jgi:hypothetical protein